MYKIDGILLKPKFENINKKNKIIYFVLFFQVFYFYDKILTCINSHTW